MTYAEYERKRMGAVLEVVGGVLCAGVVVALMWMIAKYTPPQLSAECDALAAQEAK